MHASPEKSMPKENLTESPFDSQQLKIQQKDREFYYRACLNASAKNSTVGAVPLWIRLD